VVGRERREGDRMWERRSTERESEGVTEKGMNRKMAQEIDKGTE